MNPAAIFPGLRLSLRPPNVPGHLSDHVLQRELNSSQAVVTLVTLIGLCGAVLVYWAFQHSPMRNYLLLWASVLTVVTATLIYTNLQTRERPAHPDMGEQSAEGRFIGGASALGFIWGLPPIILFPTAHPIEQTALGTVLIGLMFCGASALARTPKAASAFITPVAIGVFVGYQLSSDATIRLLSFLVIAYYAILQLAVRANNAAFVRVILSEAEISEQHQLIDLLLRDFEENSSDWLWQIDEAGRLTQSPHTTHPGHTHRRRNAIMPLGGTLFDLCVDPDQQRVLRAKITQRTSFRDLVIKVRPQGVDQWWALTGKPLYDGDQYIGFRGVAANVTAAKESENRIARMAHYDALTGVRNRVSLQHALEELCSAEPDDRTYALVAIDLDNFKWVNDTLGHPAGDHLLTLVADRIMSLCQPDDVIARIGGDEFTLIVSRPQDRLNLFVADLTEKLCAPYEVHGSTAICGASIGVCVFDVGEQEPQEIMKRADLALYAAKEDGKNCWRLFCDDLEERAARRRHIEADLQRALEMDELELHFQPQIAASTGDLVGAEALLRWHHPERGLMYPDQFIATAEDCGLITRLGDWVIRAALANARHLPTHVRVSVNISPLQLHSASLMTTIVNGLARNEIAPSRLELEITESVLMQDTDYTLDRLHSLKALGLRIALDDFGTGFSSLSYLRTFPFDKIKIDKSFVSDLEESEDSRTITRATLGLAKSLGLVCTAEGVETEYQRAFLRDQGCDELQGFLISRPCRLADFQKLFGTVEPDSPEAEPAPDTGRDQPSAQRRTA